MTILKADWLPLEEARERVLERLRPLAVERRPLLDCVGRVLAEELTAPRDLPPWDNSAMDGFAARAADVSGASESAPRTLRVVDYIPAGGAPDRELGRGEAARIMTGAPVPAGADSVIRIEHTDGGSGGERAGTTRENVRVKGGEDVESSRAARVEIRSDSDAGRNIRLRGEDMRAGDVVIAARTPLRAAEIGTAASLGRSQLSVFRRPVVGILASGDELVDLDGYPEVLAGRRIVSSNSYALAAQVAEAGAVPRMLGIASDTRESLRTHLLAARGCDLLITSAGVGMGDHDYMLEVLTEVGMELDFWRVRMKPGSALAFGRVAGLGGIPWLGLPGNPVSSMVTFELFARPALMRLAGHRSIFAPTRAARLIDEIGGAADLTRILRVKLSPGAEGILDARLTGAQGSGILTSMARADALLVVAPDVDLADSAAHPAILLGGAPPRDVPGY